MSQTTPQAWDPDRRKAALAQAVAQRVADGNRVESQSDYQAVLVRGKRPNHVLHLILSLVTALLWVPVWIILVLVGGEKRTVVAVDDFGNIIRR